MQDFRKLRSWEYGHKFVKEIYKITSTFPKHEIYGMTSQLRRAAVSIPNNIAEGCGRDGNPELKRYIVIASGSASEVEYLLLLSLDLEYISDTIYTDLNNKILHIKRMLTKFKNTL